MENMFCACKILEDFNITRPTLPYHMKILYDRGLIDSRRDGVWIKYSINKYDFVKGGNVMERESVIVALYMGMIMEDAVDER